jgi:hypothetical protein
MPSAACSRVATDIPAGFPLLLTIVNRAPEDASGRVLLSYNDRLWRAARHWLQSQGAGPADAMRNALAAVTHAAETQAL